jgi:hypothetical protein
MLWFQSKTSSSNPTHLVSIHSPKIRPGSGSVLYYWKPKPTKPGNQSNTSFKNKKPHLVDIHSSKYGVKNQTWFWFGLTLMLGQKSDPILVPFYSNWN